MTDFKGISAKIGRARDQIEALDADMDGFCKNIKQLIVHESDEDADKQAWVYRGATPDVPIEWSLRIGEILYNLRSALDHLVWQLVLANGQEPGHGNAYPIVDDEAKWPNAIRKLRGVGQISEKRIHGLQPFTGGMNLPFDVGAFWMLQCLCNIDKHRHLNLSVAEANGTGPIVFGENQPPRRTSISRRPLEGGGTLGKIEKDAIMLWVNDLEQELNPDFQIEICFDYPQNPELVAGTVPVILRECLQAVREADKRLR